MASELNHIALVNRNHEALVRLLEEPASFPEWITTISFYKAVQLVEASFVFTQVGPTTSHGERLDKLKRERRYLHIYQHFRPLWQASTIARYLSDHESGKQYKAFSDYLSPEKVVTQMVRHRLRQIEASIAKPGFLSDKAREQVQTLS